MNKIVIKGRLTKSPETRSTGTGKTVCGFSVAVNRQFDKETSDFFDVNAWGKTGEFAQKYFDTGAEILIVGSMQCRKWQDKDGNNRYSWELVAENVEFCGSRNEQKTAPQRRQTDFEEMPQLPGDDPPF